MASRELTAPTQFLCAAPSGDSAEMHILGDVVPGAWCWTDSERQTATDATDVVSALAALPDTVRRITVHINSYGGDVREGVGIYNALRSHPAEVTTVCDGMACSIASVIFMAGLERVMRPASLLMLHNPSQWAHGTPDQLSKAAEDLRTIGKLSKAAYLEAAADGELDAATLDRIMDDETWIGPEEAVRLGLATGVDAPDDASSPTQDARAAVMAALLSRPLAAREDAPAAVRLDPAQLDEIAERVARELGPAAGQCAKAGVAAAGADAFETLAEMLGKPNK